jgi:hypothetical protein
MLGSLCSQGFSYLRGSVQRNQAELLIEALDSNYLDSQVTEARAWLSLAYKQLTVDLLTVN